MGTDLVRKRRNNENMPLEFRLRPTSQIHECLFSRILSMIRRAALPSPCEVRAAHSGVCESVNNSTPATVRCRFVPTNVQHQPAPSMRSVSLHYRAGTPNADLLLNATGIRQHQRCATQDREKGEVVEIVKWSFFDIPRMSWTVRFSRSVAGAPERQYASSFAKVSDVADNTCTGHQAFCRPLGDGR
jgi:hypothetical protein